MKKQAYNIILALFATLCIVSCGYLDKAPDAGLSEEEVFGKYANFKKYFYSVYSGANFNIRCHYPLIFAGNNQKFTLEGCTDMCDMTRLQRCQPVKLGDGSQAIWTVGYNSGDSNSPNTAKVSNSTKCIRVCNMAINHIDNIQDCTTEERYDLLGQAYFVRAYTHLEIFRLYGAIPYINKVLGANDEWDLPAEKPVDFLLRCADDFDMAYDCFRQAGKIRRDSGGSLSDPDQDKPNGCAALAMKGRALLYAASPLNNTDNDAQLWEKAAKANMEAIDVALANSYKLLAFSQYTNNFYGTKYTNEQIWAYSSGSSSSYKSSWLQAYIGYPFTADKFSSAQCPTQNFIDKFETAGGYPLNTAQQRAAAVAAGQYNDQDPFGQVDGAVKRDPRFYKIIVFNGCEIQGYTSNIYVDELGNVPTGVSSLLATNNEGSVTSTFYYENKRTGNLSQKGNQNVILTDPIIRLAELYLNYAEAANEAYGPTAVPDYTTLSAVDALNVVRERAQMPGVLEEYTASADLLRDRIKNERAVELCFEGYHYYCDIRRWKDAPDIYRSTLYGLRVVKLDAGVSAEYPTGFKYERFALPSNRQIAWKNDGMYYMQFQNSDLQKMKNYVPNQTW